MSKAKINDRIKAALLERGLEDHVDRIEEHSHKRSEFKAARAGDLTCKAVAAAIMAKSEDDFNQKMASVGYGGVLHGATKSNAGLGFTFQEKVSLDMIEYLRPRSSILAADPVIIRTDGETLQLPRLDKGAIAQHIGANGGTSAVQRLESGLVEARVHELEAIIGLSDREKYGSVENLASRIDSELQLALGVGMDQAILAGDGTQNAPIGLLNKAQSSKGTNGATFDGIIDDIADALKGLANSLIGNYVRPTWFMRSNQLLKLRTMNDASRTAPFAQDLANGELLGFKVISSHNVPVNTLAIIDMAYINVIQFNPMMTVENLGKVNANKAISEVRAVVRYDAICRQGGKEVSKITGVQWGE
jgi:HK97 family phage major capsid protein